MMNEIPVRAMAIVAHPDDAEFTCAGTLAKWIDLGAEVILVVATNGNKGSADLSMTSERLAPIRRQEELAAAAVLGIKEVVFLDYPDGELEESQELRHDVTAAIRRYRPEAVFTQDPYRRYQLHRDHRIIGAVTMSAVFPAARDHLYFPDLMVEGLLPHKVKQLYMIAADEPDAWVDIEDTFDRKLAALRCHVSQVGGNENLEQMLRERAADIGRSQGLPLAEAFKRVPLRY